MKRRVVFVTGSMRRGGAERVISIIANELTARGWEVTICTILSGKIGYDLDSSIHIIDLSNEKCPQLLDIPRMIVSLRSTIKRIKPVVVVSFMLTINIITWYAVRGLKISFIPSERNDPSAGRDRLRQRLSYIAYSKSYKTVFQTNKAKSFFPKKIQDNGVIIPNPVRVSKIHSPETRKRIVSVGRLEPQKNRKLLIDSFLDIHKKYPQYTLEIYGEGSQESELRDYISSVNMENSILLHGNVDDVHERIADAELFVLSSDYEGLSNALIEAMMMGLPCVSTDCTGATDIINNGVDGLIVPIRDKEAMVNAINTMLSDESLRRQFSENAIKNSSRFAVSSVVDQWENLFNRVSSGVD